MQDILAEANAPYIDERFYYIGKIWHCTYNNENRAFEFFEECGEGTDGRPMIRNHMDLYTFLCAVHCEENAFLDFEKIKGVFTDVFFGALNKLYGRKLREELEKAEKNIYLSINDKSKIIRRKEHSTENTDSTKEKTWHIQRI